MKTTKKIEYLIIAIVVILMFRDTIVDIIANLIKLF